VSEGRYDAVGDDRLEIVRHAREGIKAGGSVDVGRVDVDKIVGASARNVGKCGFRKIAVRIEESKPSPAARSWAMRLRSSVLLPVFERYVQQLGPG